jgi:hypothetical protein
MRGKLGSWGLVLLSAFALAVGGAGAHTLATGTLVVQVLGDGYVNATGGQIDCGQGSKRCYFSSDTSASITLTASVGFGSWNGSDSCSGTSQSCTFTLGPADTDEEIATFTPTPTSTLTVNVTGDADNKGGNVSGGEIDCDPGETNCTWDPYTGSTVTLVEDPEDGYDFTGWGSACSGQGVSCTVLMSSAQTVNATFAKSASTRTLSVSVTGNGTATGGGISCTSVGGAGCTASETSGSEVTLTATAGSGAGFTGWGGACTGSLTTCTVTMSSDQTVAAAFSGPSGSSTFPLNVSVTGSGIVTGGGVNCGNGLSTCTVDVTANTSVTLTATPASGATFTSWGGACSGSATTCALTMNVAKDVSATFSGGTPATGTTATLTLVVRGKGTVSASGGACASSGPERSCKQSYNTGISVELTATPAAGAKFLGWGASCSGTTTGCTIQLSASATAEATVSGATAGAGLASRGRPVVRRGKSGFAITLRFRTGQSGTARVRAIRAGRIETALAFSVGPGPGSVGPLLVQKPGFYRFDLRQGARAIEWRVCLGRCGETAPGGPFRILREPSTVVRAGEAWSVTVRFHANRLSGAELRISRGKRLVNDLEFATPAGEVHAGPFVLSPGVYTLRLKVTDAYGRTRRLSWFAFLPR